MRRHLPAGFIGSHELLSRLGGTFKKSSINALVADGRIPGERTLGGHFQFRDDGILAKAIERLRKDPSAQRRVRRAEIQARRNEPPSPEALATVEAFARVIYEQILEMYFDGRSEGDLDAKEQADLEQRLFYVANRIMQSGRTRPSFRRPDSPRA